MAQKITTTLVEVRCTSCGKLLCYVSGTVEVKCGKCSTINKKMTNISQGVTSKVVKS